MGTPWGHKIPARCPLAEVRYGRGMTSEVVRLDGITVLRSGRPIIDNVSWSVNQGDRWVLLGANGAGKSTLLDIISARNFPTRGTAVVLGETFGLTDISELKVLIGTVSAAVAASIPPQERIFDAVITGAWSVTGRWTEEYNEQDELRCASLMRQFRIDHLAERTFGTLSAGERARTLLARALMCNPELLILDEPAVGLDFRAREEWVQTLAHLAADRSAPTIILVTHHLEEVPNGFSKALLLKDGAVVAQGDIRDVMTASTLSETYGVPVSIALRQGRYFAYSPLPAHTDG